MYSRLLPHPTRDPHSLCIQRSGGCPTSSPAERANLLDALCGYYGWYVTPPDSTQTAAHDGILFPHVDNLSTSG
jgi:hypothetical protein